MKKILFIVGVILIAIMLSGCGNQQNNQLSTEELKEKVDYKVRTCIEGGGMPEIKEWNNSEPDVFCKRKQLF
jgi:hypothetical protein